jgi:hypothetical protein
VTTLIYLGIYLQWTGAVEYIATGWQQLNATEDQPFVA